MLLSFAKCTLRPILSVRCRFLCQPLCLVTADLKMSSEKKTFVRRHLGAKHHYTPSSQSIRTTGITMSGPKTYQNNAKTFENHQRRQVHAYDCVDVLMEESEAHRIKRNETRIRHRLSSLRKWEYTKLGTELQKQKIKQPPHSLKFTVLSYNVLAQHLLEEHIYLYRNVETEALNWDKRAERILREVTNTYADILCLQEVQSDHYDTFYVPRLTAMGFKGVYKKRTGNKRDGCAIFFRHSKFELKKSIPVEYCKPNVEILDRDNIGLIALLTPRVLQSKHVSDEDLPFIVVATTHLLYNPRRHDIKLAQLQLLFAELDRIASDSRKPNSEKTNCASYHPTILTGDFNLTPDTSIYQFITQGSLLYKGLSRRQLTLDARGHTLENELIPPHLNITDQCQHLNSTGERTLQENFTIAKSELSKAECSVLRFASGQLSHQLQLQSVYPHRTNRFNGAKEATTYQNDWVTVDYIFHNGRESLRPNLQLLSRLGLLTGEELDALGGIPSLASPSDHLPLAARFIWNYRKA
ncbi:protein angel homolog 2-like isoform X2 [Daphnia carinata]|uniref:protein angel homolog 2-like isoform X2 n=1 Tax=Daphnia carinata TaxID=120202 RepID=UPI002580A42E|nr:protein angel homolog 2-like isoform X2 [Daphnia carinata]